MQKSFFLQPFPAGGGARQWVRPERAFNPCKSRPGRPITGRPAWWTPAGTSTPARGGPPGQQEQQQQQQLFYHQPTRGRPGCCPPTNREPGCQQPLLPLVRTVCQPANQQENEAAEPQQKVQVSNICMPPAPGHVVGPPSWFFFAKTNWLRQTFPPPLFTPLPPHPPPPDYPLAATGPDWTIFFLFWICFTGNCVYSDWLEILPKLFGCFSDTS